MKIRLATIYDAEEILDIYAPYVETTHISFETTVPTIDEMKIRIENILEAYPWIVLEKDNCILGYAYASRYRERAAYRWAVDISVYVRNDYRGKGIGKILYSTLFSILKLQGYYNAYAIICLPNESSIGLHEYFGFKKIAHFSKVGYKLGQWYDVGWWELLLEDHKANPSEPINFNNISKSTISKLLSLERYTDNS